MAPSERNLQDTVDDLLDQAWEAHSPNEQSTLARQALMLDHGAIDGYVILALLAETNPEKVALLREAARRGEVHEKEGIERPFMRALHNLALVLWTCGDKEEAVQLVDRMLQLNPNDNQGARYLALSWHPVLGNWSRVEKILKKCQGEVRTEHLYAYCLDCVRRGVNAEEALNAAMVVNPYVPAMLLSQSPQLLDQTSTSAVFGSEEEAATYAAFSLDAWASVPVALGWLRGAIRRARQ